MLLEIGLKARTLVARGQTWQGHTSCFKKTQLVGSLEVPTSLHQCSESLALGWQVPQTAEQSNKKRSSYLQ